MPAIHEFWWNGSKVGWPFVVWREVGPTYRPDPGCGTVAALFRNCLPPMMGGRLARSTGGRRRDV